VIEELGAALRFDDPPHVQEERSVDPVTDAEPLGRGIGRHIDAHTDDLVRHALIAEPPMDQVPLFDGVVGKGSWRVEHRPV